MLHLILEYIQSLLQQSSGIHISNIHQTNIPDEEYSNIPWISISADSGTLTPIWSQQLEQKIQHKYNINQPITIKFCFLDQNSVIQIVDNFLKLLPKHISLSNQAVALEPNSIKYHFSKGNLDHSIINLDINASWGIFSTPAEDIKIPKINSYISKIK